MKTKVSFDVGRCPNCGNGNIKGTYPNAPILAEDYKTIIISKFAVITCMDCELEIRAKSMDDAVRIWNREYYRD